MAADDYLSGAHSSLRSFIGGVRRRNTVGDQGAAAYLQTEYDPRFSSLSIQRAQQFGQDTQDAAAATNAPYGSIAQRNDPNRYGSVASRQFPGQFGPQANDAAEETQRTARDSQAGLANNIGASTAAYLAPQLSSFYNQFMGNAMQRRPVPSSNPADQFKGDDNG